MKRIMLACAMGMSTSLLVSKMKEAAREAGEEYEIWAVDIDSVDEEEDYDLVLLGPQVSYKLEDVIEEVEEGTPVYVIDKTDYGTCNGPAVLAFAKEKMRG